MKVFEKKIERAHTKCSLSFTNGINFLEKISLKCGGAAKERTPVPSPEDAKLISGGLLPPLLRIVST